MSLIKKLVNKETILYLIFGINVTVLNIILFYFFHKYMEIANRNR